MATHFFLCLIFLSLPPLTFPPFSPLPPPRPPPIFSSSFLFYYIFPSNNREWMSSSVTVSNPLYKQSFLIPFHLLVFLLSLHSSSSFHSCSISSYLLSHLFRQPYPPFLLFFFSFSSTLKSFSFRPSSFLRPLPRIFFLFQFFFSLYLLLLFLLPCVSPSGP